MITLDCLKEYGADVDDGLKRCMGNEMLYLRLVATIPSEITFQQLQESLQEGDLDTAFEKAHALKGVVGNLSLTPLYQPVVEITEHLRAREAMDYSELLGTILAEKEKLQDLCSK